MENSQQVGECSNCGHAPIRHIQDGSGWTCVVCVLGFREGWNRTICTQAQTFKLSQTEREQAAKGSRDSYPMHTVCAVCSFTWAGHLGYLCPSGDDTFLPLLDEGFLITH